MQRDPRLAFRMIDDDTVPIAVTGYRDTAHQVEALLAELRAPDRARRETFRALRPYVVTIPQRIATDPAFAALCQTSGGGVAAMVRRLRRVLGDR